MVSERTTGDRYELPVVARGPQGHLDDVVVLDAAYFAVGDRIAGPAIQRVATRTDDELPDASRRVQHTRGCLWGEALIVVVVPIEDDIRVVVV